MIDEIKKITKKDIKEQPVKAAQVIAVLANGQVQVKDQAGRISYAMGNGDEVSITQNVYITGSYVVNTNGPRMFPELEEFDV